MHDLVIRNGTIIDGTGRPALEADIAIDDGRITQVGTISGAGREEIDASGKIVTPGFVDIHTHYDGQATWDSMLAPSSLHGVTTLVMGNCGVGFAPVRPDKHDWLINLMEGIEDIPGSALAEGLTWDWETFPEYLDVLDKRRFTVDIGTHIPHGALRSYVMGDRAITSEAATDDDIGEITKAVEEGLRAGALGVSTSVANAHRAKTGERTPSTWATEDELRAIFRVMAKVRPDSVFEATADVSAEEAIDLFAELARETGVQVSFSLAQMHNNPEQWRRILGGIVDARAEGVKVSAQICVRCIGILCNWRASIHPFMYRPTWVGLSTLPWAEQNARLRDPEVRRRIIEENSVYPESDHIANAKSMVEAYGSMYAATDDTINYEPTPEESLAARAKVEGRTVDDLAYDALMAGDGNGFILLALMNYAFSNYDHVVEMLNSEATVVSLSDGGAHVGTICDASIPTFMLTHWARDRKRGPKLSLEEAVRRQTSHTANYYGMRDRGVLAPGYLADVNVIDFDRLKLEKPFLTFDLPAGGKRFMQRAQGYSATIKSGVVVSREGEFTGELPGRLVRGSRTAPQGVAEPVG